jgi:IS1 family transposase
MDEKWAFVARKEAQCEADDPAGGRQGDNWDHVAFDPEHRFVLAVVPGKRTLDKVEKLVQEVKERTDRDKLDLITTDEYPAYKTALLEAYGQEITPPKTGKPGRPRSPYKVAPTNLNYATVHKTREKGRVVKVQTRVIFGTEPSVKEALSRSTVSRHVNTAFIERQNGSDRHFNARKRRKTYCFSKDWDIHEGMTYFTQYHANFCRPVRTLRTRDGQDRRWRDRTPAMSAGLSDHVWTLHEWVRYPAIQCK